MQLDAGSLVARNASGHLVPNATLFPGGLRRLAERLRSMGLGFGVYTDISGHTCSYNPNTGSGPGNGPPNHYDLDADTFASWGADYIKVGHHASHTRSSQE